MMSPNLIENITNKIAAAMGMTLPEFEKYQKEYMVDIDKQLEKRFKAQQLTPEVLNKRCTL